MSDRLAAARGVAGRWLVLAAAYVVAGRIGLSIPYLGAFITLVWLPTGIAVAALVRWGVRMWPGVALGALAVNVWIGAAPAVAVGITVGNTLAPLATAVLLRAGFDPGFQRRVDVGAFLLAAALGMILSALGGVLVLSAAGIVDRAHAPDAALTWWLGDTLGVLLAGPLLLSSTADAWRELRDAGPAFLGSLTAGAGLSLALFLHPWHGQAWSTLLVLPVGLIAWSALRLNPTGTSLVTLVLALGAAGGVVRGVGPFASADPFEDLRVLSTYAAMMVGMGLLLTAMLAERRAGERALARSEARYRDLFDATPAALCVYAPESGQILMANEAALMQYGFTRAEFLQMRVHDLRPAAQRNDALLPVGASHVPGRHVSRDGRTLEVEQTVGPFEYEGREACLLLARDTTTVRRLERRLERAAADERQRLMRDIHDGLGQELTGLTMFTRALETRRARDGAVSAADLARVHSIASGALQTCRRVSRGLSPLHVTQGGLPRALEEVAAQLGSPDGPEIALEIDETVGEVPLPLAEHLLGIAREALTNAVRHAGAGRVKIALRADEGTLSLTVEDDGRGFDATGARGIGMETMEHRARLLGAEFAVRRRARGGTRVACRIALPDAPGAIDGGAHAARAGAR